jgi:hypothetical protein
MLLYGQDTMRHRRRGEPPSWGVLGAIVALAFLVAVALAVAGCGGGSGGSSSSSDGSAPGSSKEFNDPEGGREVATFGKEADAAERAAASAVLTENLAARQEAEFDVQCATLGQRGMDVVLGVGSKPNVPACKAKLEELAKPLEQSKAIRTDTLDDEIAALRVKGNEGYALYHGNDGKDYGVQMEKEDGKWKVGSVVTLELPKTKPAAAKTNKKKEA